ncbi:MAG: sensor histidine kinase, partial [Lacticaseibacillus paracasei]|nr:sensor histidine kinase [Lacticaseibacillus paracasei]
MRRKLITRIKNLEWTSYIWLVYLPAIMAEFIPVKSEADWFWLGLSVLFL